jgi:hypothetical protein
MHFDAPSACAVALHSAFTISVQKTQNGVVAIPGIGHMN